MQSSGVLDETSSLADSAYELISSTDGESQDGRGTDSLAASITSSFNIYPRADDVLSLSGNETAYDEEEEEDADEDEVEDEEDDASSDGGHLDQSSGYLHTQTRNTPGHSQLYHAGRGSGEDNNGARRSSPADSMRYAEEALCNPSTQSLSTLEYDSSHGDISGGHSTLNQSIEFNEGADVKPYIEKVSVKHTIREFSEGESAIIAANMDMKPSEAPKRMAATICQTMSRYCLSTCEPLRILYVGNDGAFNDIMRKISSAILASAPSSGSPSPDAERRHSSTPGIYNIIPTSSFGSSKVPEIDEIQLMCVSDYYIKVDRCVNAEETIYEGESSLNDTIYSIELDSGSSHVSVFDPSGSVVSPGWALPHVAVFYVSGNDDKKAEKTRNAAWEFMTRHAVPSIFISHTQSFSRQPFSGRWQDFVDHAAVHLSLESRDPSKPATPERLPIDLVSFLNIDARQMNRNLAYLTGLKDIPSKEKKNAGKSWGIAGWAPFLPVLLRFLGIIMSAAVTFYLTQTLVAGPILARFERPSAFKDSIVRSSLSSATSSRLADSARPTYLAAISSICSAPSVTPTVTISFVSTKTVEVHVSEPTGHPSQVFGGYLTDIPHSQRSNNKGSSDAEIKSTGCSIQVYSSHEILVKVPAATKTKWLAKGAIDIDVWRGQKLLKSKLFTTSEGIIIEIDQKDAFGVMSVSIVTTLRPKINETFAVDFGQPTTTRLLEAGFTACQDFLRAAAGVGQEAASHARKAFSDYAAEHNISLPHAAKEQGILGNASSLFHSVTQGFATFKDGATKSYQRLRPSSFFEKATQGFATFKDDVTKSYQRWRPNTLFEKAAHEVQSLVEELVPTTDVAEKLRADARLAVRRAQIASKLWWLRVQGKMQEHDTYETKAAEHIRKMELDIQTDRHNAHADKRAMEKVKDVKLMKLEGCAPWLW